MRAAIIAAALSCGLAQGATAQCRQALALGLDVSGSVDLREYRLQLDGLVAALNDPEVMQVLLAQPGAPVSMLVFEWSGPDDQIVLVPWTAITDHDDLRDISLTLARAERRVSTPGTALGTAMQFGAALLAGRSNCWKQTLDISGDGKSNQGPRPRDVRDHVATGGLTINGLVIGADAPAYGDRRQSDIGELSSYFRAEVIAGPDAFVQTALGFEDYQAAMTQKLLRELSVLAIGALQ